MKNILLWISLALALAATAPAATLDASAPQTLMPLKQQADAAAFAARILTRYHYKALPLDEAMSENIFDRYLKALDPEKLFFVQADIDQWADARPRPRSMRLGYNSARVPKASATTSGA